MMFEGEVLNGPEKGIVLRTDTARTSTLKCAWPDQHNASWTQAGRRIDYEFRDGGWRVSAIWMAPTKEQMA